MKILLVNPTRSGKDSYITPPLHLLYIANAIEDKGHHAELLDVHYNFIKENHENIPKDLYEERCIQEIVEKDYDVLGVGSIIVSYPFTKRLCSAVKQKRPNTPIIIGGGMSMALKQLWEERTDVDYLVESDGELVIQSFLEAFPDRQALANIPGLHYRGENGKFVRNPPKLPKVLDYISMPRWYELKNLESYQEIMKYWINLTLPPDLALTPKDKVLSIVMTRGCPYKCTFCYHVNHLHRRHSPEYIVNMMRESIEKYGITVFMTLDDLIMANVKWLSALCDALIEADLGVRIFTSGGKANLISREVVKKMKQANFFRVSLGVESGSQTILDKMHKQHSVEENGNAVKVITSEGLFTHLNMIIGFPGETFTTLKETRKFLSELASLGLITRENVSFSYATAFPGTDLYQQAMEMGKVPTDIEQYLSEQAGLGEYRYNLCGISAKRLAIWRELTLFRVKYLSDRYFNRAWQGYPRNFYLTSRAVSISLIPKPVIRLLKRILGKSTS
ncbi:MAG: B12-binding domain-containing radical SAM protein [Magnetococcales bacterium]|nr:B12-binding domain-containing radical SAM protein [Magnetococcales bacterium]